MSRCTNNPEYERLVPHSELCYEAHKGNTAYLQTVRQHLGYVQYDSCIVQAALNDHQYEFWLDFLDLSRGTLPCENYPWDARSLVITDLLMGFRGPEYDLYGLYRSIYDTFLLNTSLKDSSTDTQLSLEFEADLCIALALRPPQRLIIDYMVSEKGFLFKAQHLELAQLTFDRDLVQYVRQHLNLEADVADDPEPNDCDLACLFIDAVHFHAASMTGYNLAQDRTLIQFLLDYPHMIDKMYFLMDYLQTADVYHRGTSPADLDFSDTASIDSLSLGDESAQSLFYSPELAAQLTEGILESDESESTQPTAFPADDAPNTSEVHSEPSWVDLQLLSGRSNPASFIEDLNLMCGLILIEMDQIPPGLQRWDLIERLDPGPDRRPFQMNSIPSRLQSLARHHDWFHLVRNQLVRLNSCDSLT